MPTDNGKANLNCYDIFSVKSHYEVFRLKENLCFRKTSLCTFEGWSTAKLKIVPMWTIFNSILGFCYDVSFLIEQWNYFRVAFP